MSTRSRHDTTRSFIYNHKYGAVGVLSSAFLANFLIKRLVHPANKLEEMKLHK